MIAALKFKHMLTMAGISVLLSSCSPTDVSLETSTSAGQEVAGGPVVMRRITEGQYERIIAHVF